VHGVHECTAPSTLHVRPQVRCRSSHTQAITPPHPADTAFSLRELRSVCCLECLGDIRATADKWARAARDASLPAHEREAAHKKSVALCPACTLPIGQEVAETGEAVNAAPTFVMQARPVPSTHPTAAHAVGRPPTDRTGRGRFRGRGARGIAGRGSQGPS
jgi:hypothetical protein